MKREVQSLKSELRALRTGHLTTSEVRLPCKPEENHRHEVNGHAEYDNCVKSSGISRHPRRVYSESCAFDYASVTFKESDGYVTVLTGRGPRCECFCRVVPRKGRGADSTGWLEREAAGKSKRTSGHLGSRDVRSQNEPTHPQPLKNFGEHGLGERLRP